VDGMDGLRVWNGLNRRVLWMPLFFWGMEMMGGLRQRIVLGTVQAEQWVWSRVSHPLIFFAVSDFDFAF